MFDLIIRGGTLVTAAGQESATLAIAEGVIKAVAPPDEAMSGAREVDASGRLVFPGLGDAHVHIPGYLLSTRLEDFPSATTAAALGEGTSVLLTPADAPPAAARAYFWAKPN